jgi:hypothetical protein
VYLDYYERVVGVFPHGVNQFSFRHGSRFQVGKGCRALLASHT